MRLGRDRVLQRRHPRGVAGPPASVVLGLVATLVVAACGGGGSTAGPANGGGSPSAEALSVVTTTTVFADMVRNVGGDLVRVSSLVPKGGDVHTFSPKPADIQTVSTADAVGHERPRPRRLARENHHQRRRPAARRCSSWGSTCRVSKLLPGEDPGTQNPHLWMDVKYGELYVDRIAEALKSIDGAHASQYDSQAATYKERLDALDAERAVANRYDP